MTTLMNWQLRIMLAGLSLIAAFAGCSPDVNKNKVRKNIEKLTMAVNRSDWQGMEALMATNFELVSGSRRVEGADRYVKTFSKIRSRRGFSIDNLVITRVTAAQYTARFDAEMKTSRSGYQWRIEHQWDKSGTNWLLTSAEVNRKKRRRSRDSDVVSKPSPRRSSPSSSDSGGSSGFGGGVGGFVDNAAGASGGGGGALSAKKHILGKLGED